MIESVIAVAGTLLGSVTAYVLQQRAARSARSEDRATERRRDVVAAVAQLTAALADHRRAMWVREDLRLSGAADEEYRTARADSHATRAAITAPLATVAILAPDLAPVATEAAQATYALRHAPDRDALTTARTAAIAATDRLVAEAARQV
ncbi:MULTISPECIES: hypothetical protein [Streptomycetaceae]|uniref:Protein kilB n=1 Tax=Streptantibioticus cattleyicolor (strain ATCC 35852 / DSM 46488 / JCM 4925 / NBRC 14057 / NRRL 8057) TaxID=1003195 RepID=F8JYA7_STREN|nr:MULTISPECIES: hypothetical protein [Streptomycetaceae]AEW95901.1 hypothetical protein SCATT_35300 [Streptantibioticus cattleyicolor NRRL 8057 = DSM 46488]MYS60439.1 protein kilB [Streptomyces sp. SID5468]CCB76237.1 Protein kilB [Streptantibioticus cattleyicolor NRRL 8057 = DSM 46488]